MHKNSKPGLIVVFINLLAALLLSQCALPPGVPGNLLPPEEESVSNPSAVPEVEQTTSAPETRIEITFKVQIPELDQSHELYLDLLDEVTGLALNSKRFVMQRINDGLYEIKIPFVPGSLIKYRYARSGNPTAIEHNTSGSQVRYRMLQVLNPGEVNDIVAAWSDLPYHGDTGRIMGQVSDISGNPLPDILITAGGTTTLTTSDGSFLLEGIPPGTHNLVACSINGDYLAYQQGALVAANATTPAPLQLPPTHIVNVTFILQVHEELSENLPIRLIGNIYSLGNTFANLPGGSSVSAIRAPVLSVMEDGRYTITVALPAGLDLRYKYTMGDGFWNTEHHEDGSFRIRQLIVPDTDTTVEDNVQTWSPGDFKPVLIHVEVPESTPKSDVISVQFNPYAWTEPLQMNPTGTNQWTFVLQSPLHLLSNISYRYCRNDQCGIADPAAVVGNLDQFVLQTTDLPLTITDKVLQWSWMELEEGQTRIVGKDVNLRGENFAAGIELQAHYEPSMLPHYASAFKNIRDVGSNWTILTPTWHYTSENPPVLEASPGKDPLWHDLAMTAEAAQAQNLHIALFPQSIPKNAPAAWWAAAERDAGWWQSWFDRYRTFLLHYADFAQQHNIQALILGENGMRPALPAGLLPGGEPSNVFPDAEERWDELIEEIRGRYSGQLIWAVQEPAQLNAIDGFLSKFDRYYILVSSPLTDENGEPDLNGAVSRILDDEIYPFVETSSKPVWIGIKYPSTPGAINGCIDHNDSCVPFEALDQPALTPVNVPLDLQIQFDIYEAFLSEVNEREWVDGIVSRGYYPPVQLQDLSSSVHGKPASALLWYWYPRFLTQQ